MLAEMSCAQRTFFVVSLEMLEPGRSLPCDIWLRHDGGEPILYRSESLPFETHQIERLEDSGVHTVLISFADADRWADHLGRRLRNEVWDRNKPLADRIEVLLRTSRATMNDVFLDPRAPGVQARVGHVADSVSEMMRSPAALATSVRMMEHDYYTYTHSLHVATYGLALARASGIEDETYLSDLGRGFLMHDVGKVGLPASLLNKRGRLTKAEFEQMKTHPKRGTAVLDDGEWGNRVVRDVVFAHHERIDGTGYPQGLHSELVSTGARIAAICDAFDAMTSDRPYAKAMSAIKALTVIRNQGQHAYDQKLVRVFITTLLDPQEG